MCLALSYSLGWYLCTRQHTQKNSPKHPICSNRPGQQVVNVNQYPEQKPLPLSFQLSEWQRYANRSAALAHASDCNLPLLPNKTSTNSNAGQPSTNTHTEHRGVSGSAAPMHGRIPPWTDRRTGPPGSVARPVPLVLTIDEDNYNYFLPDIRKTHFVE